MTTAGPFRPGRRRWLVVAAGLVVACVLVFRFTGQPQVYVAEAEVTFTPPASVLATTSYEGYVDTMIAFAGVVSATYNQRHPSTPLSSPRATLVGNGLHEGVSVRPSMTGNQWRVGFDRPVVVVTASAFTEEDALATVHQTVQRLADIAVQLQEDVGVDPAQRVVPVWSTQEITVDSFGPTRQSTVKGAAILALVVLLLSGLVGAALDRRRDSRDLAVASYAPAVEPASLQARR